MSNTLVCSVCSNQMGFLQEIDNIVQTQAIISDSFLLPKTGEMKIYSCSTCTHIQIKCELPADFYEDDYDENKGYAQYTGALDLTEAKLKKLKQFAADNKRFLDIGCGAGHAIGIAQSMFDECVGVEPAKNTYEIAKSKGYNVINDYFAKGLNLDGKFSAFASFQVFEHLSDPYSVLDYAREVLTDSVNGGGGRLNQRPQRPEDF